MTYYNDCAYQDVKESRDDKYLNSHQLKDRINKIIEQSLNRIESLKKSRSNFDAMRSNIDLIKKSLNVQSILDKTALFIARRNIFEKLGVSLMVFSISGLAIAAGLISATIMLLGALTLSWRILSSHAENLKVRENRVLDDVVIIENALLKELEHLMLLEQQLTESMVLYNQEIIALCDSNSSLHETVDALTELKDEFEQTIDELHHEKSELLASLTRFQNRTSELDAELCTMRADIAAERQENINLAGEIEILIERVHLAQEPLSDIHRAYVERVARLTEVSRDLRQGVNRFNEATNRAEQQTSQFTEGLTFFDTGSQNAPQERLPTLDECHEITERILRERGVGHAQENNAAPILH